MVDTAGGQDFLDAVALGVGKSCLKDGAAQNAAYHLEVADFLTCRARLTKQGDGPIRPREAVVYQSMLGRITLIDDQPNGDAVELATELTIAWLSNPNTRAQASEIPDFLRAMHEAVSGLTSDQGAKGENGQGSDEAAFQPAVTVRKSLASRDHIISLIDGKSYKTLKRHLSNNGLTPAEYRKRYGLKADYPMVAPAYAEQRRKLAKAIGLGRKPRGDAAPAEKKPAATTRGRKRSAAAE